MAARKPRKGSNKSAAARRPWFAYSAWAFSLLLGAGLVGGGYHYLSQPGQMPLRVVEVKGEFRHLSQAEIRETAGAAIDGGFFTCDMPRLRRAVLAMPWVEDVAIRRVWPDRLVMRVTERTPLARWGTEALISADAEVFRPGNVEPYETLPRIHGPDGSQLRVVDFYREVSALAGQRELAVRAVTLDQRRHWWVEFANGLTLSLGRDDRDQRLGHFLRVYPRLVADPQRQPERVDMRYAHGFAVKWRDAEAIEAKTETRTAQEKV
jgi:cell division protein FtsQ